MEWKPGFNYGLAYRALGVDPSYYDDDPQTAMRMMHEDLVERWGQDRGALKQAMLQQAAKERNAPARRAPAQARQEGEAEAAGNLQRAHQRADRNQQQGQLQFALPTPQGHFGHHQNMVNQVNDAWKREMDSRVQQGELERQRQHEMKLAQMQKQPQQQHFQPAPLSPSDAQRQARNRSLLSMAGLGRRSIKTNGRGGVKVGHGYFGPMSNSLLGE